MKITSLVDNIYISSGNDDKCVFPTEHGLSLHITLENGKNILFDMGQTRLFADNAERLGIDIANVDAAIISHGHYDHGGGLAHFLSLNTKARVYVRPAAFERHYSLHEDGMHFIGIDDAYEQHKTIVRCDSDYSIPDVGICFPCGDCGRFFPLGNKFLYGPEAGIHDSFLHEHSLIVHDGANYVLIAGCAHCGITNIIDRAQSIIGRCPDFVVAGMHLMKSGLSAVDEQRHIAELCDALLSYPVTHYYTMHCIGAEQFAVMKTIMHDRIDYLSCGESVHLI